MAHPANGLKKLNLNKPKTFNGDQEKFRKFLQDIKVYMDVNHKVYNTDLRKVAFILSFMNAGAAATWKAQFINEANAWPTPANPNDELGAYMMFRKELIEAFSMFNSVGDALDELWALRMEKNDLINEHIAKFKMLAAKSKIDTTTPWQLNCLRRRYPGAWHSS
jgi:Domain of unknown function (DUF4939)